MHTSFVFVVRAMHLINPGMITMCSHVLRGEGSSAMASALDADAAAAAAGDVLVPPYIEGDNPLDGLACYFPGCKYKGHAWGKIMQHIKVKHKVKPSSIQGTYLFQQGNPEINLQQKAQYEKRKRKKAPLRQTTEHKGEGVKAENKQPDQSSSSSQHIWKQALCWVKCTADGEPVGPLQVGGLVSDAGVPMMNAAHAPSARPQAHFPASPSEMKAGPGSWASKLPKVSIKQVYQSTPAPAPSVCGGRTQKWPVDLEGFRIDIPEFKNYLATERAHGSAAQQDCLRGLARVFHMLEVEGHGLSFGSEASDPAVLVALHISGLHKELFSLPLLAPVFTWTGKILAALQAFCAWQQIEVSRQHLISDEVHWLKFAASIDQLSVALKGGLHKKSTTGKHKRALDRRLWDAAKIEGLPPLPLMKVAVSKAMGTLHHIAQLHQGLQPLQKAAQSAANAALTGILWLNGFGGRKKEWEIMLRDHCHEQLNQGLDYFVCHSHKTSNTYGSLAKWIAPGTAQAIKVYLDLPCRASVKTLFVPLDEDMDHISIPKALKKFCVVYLPESCTQPTVNLMRKWYHTELYRLATNETRLMELMRGIDAHSTQVAKKHYVLQHPADDAKLAQALVHAMLGKPVPWPCDFDQQDLAGREAPFLQLVAVHGHQDDDIEEEDAPDSELEWWEGGEAFGLHKPLHALQDALDMEAQAGRQKEGEQSMEEELKHDGQKDLQQPAKKGRLSPFTPEQKAWIASRAQEWGTGPPPSSTIRSYLEDGIAAGKLPAGTTLDQVRHVCRVCSGF